MRCDGPAAAVEERILLAIGIASAPSPVGRLRRRASRQTWARSSPSALACFLLSTRGPAEQQAPLQREAARQHDMLFFNVAEKGTLTAEQAKRAGFKSRTHGHCVLKNWAWFRFAASTWPGVPWVAKVDDDTLVNLPPMLRVLQRLSCHSNVFLGPMRWTSWLPAVPALGIRSIPCGYSTGGLLDALQKLSKPMTTLFGADPAVAQRSCDALGAVPPFPFALGSGYIFSSALLRRLANSTAIARWVDEAQAAGPGDPQIIFFSDTTVGYWLSLLLRDSAAASAHPVVYVDIAPWFHDHCCRPPGSAGKEAARRHAQQAAWRCGDNYRPASPTSLLVHGLKHGGFRFAFEQTSSNGSSGSRLGSRRAVGYDHERCLADVFSKGRRRLLSHEHEFRGQPS